MCEYDKFLRYNNYIYIYIYYLFGFCFRSCIAGSLSHKKAKGKIVLCYRGQGISRYAGSLEVKRSGGAGMILGLVPAVGARLHADPHFVPATAVSYDDANRILKYIKSHRNPTATIVPPITIYGSRPAPAMANFTSRGPSLVDPHFLKVFFFFFFFFFH